MRFILDINILISAIIKKNSIIRALLNIPFFDFYLPSYALKELEKNEKIVIEKSGLEKQELRVLVKLLLSRVKVIEERVYSRYCGEAEKIIGRMDEKDVPYVALALATENDGIWTADKHFKRQNAIKTLDTADILELLK